jgi:PadR family transcriptional regulator PadR
VTGQAQLLPGTLDLLILEAVDPLPVYGLVRRIGQISCRALLIEEDPLFPALFRLARQELLTASGGKSDNNRRRGFYELTSGGRSRLRQEASDSDRPVAAMTLVPGTQPEEI